MKGIYFKDGVYICIDTPKFNWKLSIIEVNGELESQVYLYGGRVYIDFYTGWEYPFFFIDGIPIMNEKISNKLSLPVIASYLNSFETHGVDAFLKNYKVNVEFLYGELKEMNQKTEFLLSSEQDNSRIINLLSELKKLRELLLSVLTILFSLKSFMSAGLENEKVISVYQSIMDTIS